MLDFEMTSYQGGKQRLGKKIYNIIKDIERQVSDEPLPYLEPFVGYCGVMKHFASDEGRECYASDANPDIIAMWKALQRKHPFTHTSRHKAENEL